MGICPYCIFLTVTFILGNKASKLDTVPLYRTDSVTFRHALLHYVIRIIFYPDLIGQNSLGFYLIGQDCLYPTVINPWRGSPLLWCFAHSMALNSLTFYQLPTTLRLGAAYLRAHGTGVTSADDPPGS